MSKDAGENVLFDEIRYFFYITNDFEMPIEQVVREANQRCNQENLIEQLKNGVRALHAPVNTPRRGDQRAVPNHQEWPEPYARRPGGSWDDRVMVGDPGVVDEALAEGTLAGALRQVFFVRRSDRLDYIGQRLGDGGGEVPAVVA